MKTITKINRSSSILNPGTLICLLFALLLVVSSAKADDWAGWNVGAGLTYLDPKVKVDTGSGYFEADEGSLLGGISTGYTFGVIGGGDGNTGFRIGTKLDLAFGDFSSTATDSSLGDLEIDGHFAGSALLRLGYTTDRLWVYGLLGISGSDAFVRPVGLDETHVIVTGAIGFGAEFQINPKWSLNAEALFGSEEGSDQKFGSQTRNVTVENTFVRIGVTRRF